MNYNPFISVDVQNLSRINNQKGIFLWDIGDILIRSNIQKIIPTYVFKHNGKTYLETFIDKSYIYPDPNALEIEIERAEQVIRSYEFKKYTLPKLFRKKIYRVPDIVSVTEKYLPENPWDSKFAKLSNRYSKNKTNKEIIEISIEEIDHNKLVSVIKDNKKSIESGRKFEISIIKTLSCKDLFDRELNDTINEVIQKLIYYNYSSNDIATVIDSFLNEFIRLKANKEIENFNEFKNSYLIGNYRHDFTLDKMMHIGIADNSGIETRAYIPVNYLRNIIDPKIHEIKKKIDSSDDEKINLALSSWENLFLDLNKFPKKLFTFEEIKYLFLNYILPYQFIARPKHSRIYSINDLKILGPE